MKLKWIVLIPLIILVSLLLFWYLGINGLFAAIPSSLLILVLSNLECVENIIASSYKIGRKFNFWFEKNAVEKRLENTINSASRKVNEEGITVLPHGIDIKWVEPMSRDAFLKEGKIVVCLEPSYNEARNLARATILYVAEDLIRESQRFINPTVMKSLSFALARKILMLDKRYDALKCLNEEFIEQEISKTPKLRDLILAMEKLDEKGFLTRILLREFSQLDAKLSPALSDARAMKETETFTEFLKIFVEKKPEEDVPLRHDGEIIKVHLLPVTRSIEEFDISVYVKRASQSFDAGIETIYVLAWARNIVLAESVVKRIENTNKYKLYQPWEFTLPRKQGGLKTYIGVLVRV